MGNKSEKSKSKSKHKNEEIVDAFHALAVSAFDFCDYVHQIKKQFYSKMVSDPQWSVISMLYYKGPKTVPQIARAKQLTRQSIQNTVNILLQDGSVELINNIAHKRSHLVSLTPKGQLIAEEMGRKEKEIILKMQLDLDVKKMVQAKDVLQSLKKYLESKQWKDELNKINRRMP